jgi:hypothetical protein
LVLVGFFVARRSLVIRGRLLWVPSWR